MSMAEAEINLSTNLNKSSFIMSVTLVCEDQRFSAHKRLKWSKPVCHYIALLFSKFIWNTKQSKVKSNWWNSNRRSIEYKEFNWRNKIADRKEK